MNIRTVVAVFIIFILSSCGVNNQGVLYLFSWSYYIPYDILYDFRKETGIKVVVDTYDSNESMYAKLRTGSAFYDVVLPSADYMEIMRDENMLAPIDRKEISNLEYIDEEIFLLLSFDPYQEYSVPYFIGSAGINIDRNRVDISSASWGIFSDNRFKNRMVMMNDVRETLGAALAYNGFSINSVDPQEIEIAKNTLLQWKPNLLKFDAEMFGKDFASGAVSIAHGYSEVVLTELEDADNIDYDYLLPTEGGLIYVDNLVILTQSLNKDLAHIFINYLLRPDIHARIADTFYYPVLMQQAREIRTQQPAYELNQLVELGYEVKRNIGDEGNSLYAKAWSEIFRN